MGSIGDTLSYKPLTYYHMSTNSFLNCERKRIEEMKNYQLPNSFKRIGIAVIVLAFLSLILNKMTLNMEEWRMAAKYGMLIGMLMISISKEKIEDELVEKLRMRSYTFSFIAGVSLSLVQPFINYLVDFFLGAENPALQENGDFEILWILLSVQVFYFEFLKRVYK